MKKPIKPISKPEISVVIPCRNCKGYILRALRSIQNQDYNNLEIIINNDFSSDDTLSYLKHLKNEDPRIKILNNKQSMGTLYTRSIGALSAIGKYIFPMDSDDLFLDKDVLSTIKNIADKGSFDLVVFYTISSSLKPNVNSTSYKIYNNKKERKANLVLFQPEMGYYPLRPYNKEYNVKKIEKQCFSRCVRTKIYKNALNKLGKERYSRHMLLGEDVITNYILFNTARSMKYISKFGYLYVNRTGSVSKRYFNKLELLRYRIYMLDDFIVFSQNTVKNKKVVVTLALYCLKNESLKDVLKKSKNDYNLFISCLDKLLKCKYISEKDKNIIRKNENFF